LSQIIGFAAVVAVLSTQPFRVGAQGVAAGRDTQAGQAAGAGRAGTDGRSGRPGDAPGSLGWKWWNDPDIRKQLKLVDEQAASIEGIFEKRQADVQPWVDMFYRESDRLTRMTRERVAQEPAYTLQVSRVEAVLSRLRESRTVMMYRMFMVLQPEQHRKLQDILGSGRPADGRGRTTGSGR
jgi:Spy/CpxP family protein refolding chaperone